MPMNMTDSERVASLARCPRWISPESTFSELLTAAGVAFDNWPRAARPETLTMDCIPNFERNAIIRKF
jgi:hypothetical protein